MSLLLHGPNLPDRRLQRVAGLDGRGEAHAEERERGRVSTSNCRDDRTRTEAERGESVQNHSAEARCLTNCRVYMQSTGYVQSVVSGEHETKYKTH